MKSTTNDPKNETWERLEAVIHWSNMTINAFARHIGLLRGENLYQIKKGNNGLSINVANLICEKFPEIDELWLLTGKNSMLLSEDKCRCRGVDKDVTPEAVDARVDSCRLCIAGRILPVLLEQEIADPVGMAVRYTEDLIVRFQKDGKL